MTVLAVAANTGADFISEAGDSKASSQIVLIGNAGSSIWDIFCASAEFKDGLPHPMDRWSRRIGTELALETGAEVLFPFDGPPYPPVLDWARQAGQAFPSPVSMSIHGVYGLWHAYRFALLFRDALCGSASSPPLSNPCLDCAGRPCLSSCPVDAFSPGEYRLRDCVDYLAADARSDCRQTGCAARRACPFAAGFRYVKPHARFHMEAFLLSQSKPAE